MKKCILSTICLLAMLAGFAPNANAQFPPVAPPPEGTKIFRDLAYVKNGRRQQQLDIYMPKDAKKPPLIVMIHGGAFLYGDKGGEHVDKFLNAGFAVASLNYRLIQDAIFPAAVTDCKAAVRWLRANASSYGYDPDKFGAYGESAGGYLVAMLGTTGDTKVFDVGENLKVSSKVQAVADFFGPTDFLQMDAHRLPDGWVADDPTSPASQFIGGPIQENKEKVRKANPVTYISKRDAPFFIAHGDQDKIVPYHQSVLLEAALKKAGLTATFYTLKGVGHGFQDPTADKMAVDFFKKYLVPVKGK